MTSAGDRTAPRATDADEVPLTPATDGTVTPQSTPPRVGSPRPASLSDDEDREDDLPPAYGDHYGFIDSSQEGIGTQAAVAYDGRVNVRINQKTRGLSSLLVPALRSQINLLEAEDEAPPPTYPESPEAETSKRRAPFLNVVIHVVGSRGDVQPFIALGKALKEQHGHRVRLATHPVFKSFVEEHGLEFFSIGGDPSELMAFMVKNPGLMPGFDTLRRGDVGKRRKEIGQMVTRCWRSCIESGNGMDSLGQQDDTEEWRRDADDLPATRPFVADAIIANPPSFAHIHCAEKLGVPLHMMFTMPWSPTRAFPHPLANIQATDADTSITNYLSYALVEMMTWQGLGDVINRFRQKSLGLEEISATSAPAMLARLKVPWTYCWSPALIPKPSDWRNHISISGFYFLNLSSNYEPEQSLADFLAAGPPPVYIGFGSIVVDDPNEMTRLIFEAVIKSGQRALVSKGWGGFGADEIGIPDGVYMVGNVPHDWLFQRVSCVVHHGGAGTTAAGITAGKPTVIVPFFGDQPFWGGMVARAGAGPKPIPNKLLTSENLSEAILEALKPEAVAKAKQMSERISHERGTETGAASFHQQLDIDKLRCTLSPSRAAVWRIRRTQVRLSAFAATVLLNRGLLTLNDLKLFRPREYDTEEGPYDPITGGTSALVGTMTSMTMGIADFPVETLKALKIHPSVEKIRSKSSGRKDSAATATAPATSMTTSAPPTDYSPPATASTLGGGSPSRTATDTELSTPPQPHVETSATDIVNPNSLSPQGTRDAESLYRQPTPIAQSVQDEASSSHVSLERPTTSEQSALEPSHSADQSLSPPKAEDAAAQEKGPGFNLETTFGTGKGVFRITTAAVKSPMDFAYQMARGFHNAPKLYGDTTVRKTGRITGISSGLKEAGKGFGLGLSDGITDLFTMPYKGAKKEGAAGFFKGFGKGIGSFALKPSAAMWALPAYTFKGIYREIQNKFGPSIDSYVISQRTAQGYEEMANSTAAEQQAIVTHWERLRWYIIKKKSFAEIQKDFVQTITDEGHLGRFTSNVPFSPRMRPVRRTNTELTEGSAILSPDEERPPPFAEGALPLAQTDIKRPPSEAEDADLEEVIRKSVQETSRGDPEEDAAIERAIRTSIAELEASRSRGANKEELERAMQARIEEAHQGLPNPVQQDEEEEDLSKALEESLQGTDPPENDAELERALQESKQLHEKSMAEEEKAKQEEEIIMRYIMKQSEAEERIRKNASTT